MKVWCQVLWLSSQYSQSFAGNSAKVPKPLCSNLHVSPSVERKKGVSEFQKLNRTFVKDLENSLFSKPSPVFFSMPLNFESVWKPLRVPDEGRVDLRKALNIPNFHSLFAHGDPAADQIVRGPSGGCGSDLISTPNSLIL